MRWKKFRVWYKRYPEPLNGEMRYFKQSEDDFPLMCRKYQSDEWMEYTGITDKTNKEIFDGDIIETPKSIFDESLVKLRVKKVGAAFALVDPVSHNNIIMEVMPYYVNKTAVVIGNIHENPELTKY